MNAIRSVCISSANINENENEKQIKYQKEAQNNKVDGTNVRVVAKTTVKLHRNKNENGNNERNSCRVFACVGQKQK